VTSFAEVSALTDRELDARINLARQIEHPALAGLVTERDRRTKHRLQRIFAK
jgi:hypothetical protein